jgi:cell division protein FtsI (penicillin-binding protein 3)
MASLPDFDANNAGSFALSQAHKNHATADLYEMGSVMKIFNHALAIENGLDQSAVFDVSKPEFIGAHPVADSHPHERLSFAEAFAQSSNRAAIQIARKTGLAAQKEFFAKLGFFDRIPLESGDSAMPTRPERWTRTTGLSASYGYGHAITMLHAAAGANSIVGEGIYIAPTMLALKPDQHNIRNRQTAKESTSAAMRELMGEVVREGTGRAAGGGEVDLGGKTGTANKYDPALRGYASDKKRTFFIAALPLANPTFTLMIMLDEPKNGACTDASCTAAPVARKIIDGISPLLAGRR